jgi:hypothetical protein
MIIALLLGLLALAFVAYFLHLFFQINKSESKLEAALADVEASMLQQYGRPKIRLEEPEERPRRKPPSKSESVNEKA